MIRDLSPAIYMVTVNGRSLPEIYSDIAINGGSLRMEELQVRYTKRQYIEI